VLYKIRYQNGKYSGTKNIVSDNAKEAITSVKRWVRSQCGITPNEHYEVVDSIKVEPDTLENRMDKIYNF